MAFFSMMHFLVHSRNPHPVPFVAVSLRHPSLRNRDIPRLPDFVTFAQVYDNVITDCGESRKRF